MSLNIKKREAAIEQQFTAACEKQGWLVRKYVTPGHNGAPDRIVIADRGVVGWAELKRPGRPLDPLQVIEVEEITKREGFAMRVQSAFDIATFVATMQRRIHAAF